MHHHTPSSRLTRIAAFAALAWASATNASDLVVAWKFDFAPGPFVSGFTKVHPDTLYGKEQRFGFEPGAKVVGLTRSVTADAPFHFSVALPEGNYAVTVTLGDAAGVSATTVKAELRRLMLENVTTEAGKFVTRTFVVNIRTPKLSVGDDVRLKDREKKDEWRAWDEKLTLEFNGSRPCVSAIEIAPAHVPTVFLLGDSTVCDQPHEPYASWGQMLPRFFTPGVAIANHAESGEALKSSLAARRLAKVLDAMRPSDYLIVQYGHNDMKSVTAEAYKADLSRFVAGTRKVFGTIVLVTPVNRRTFQGGTVTNSLKDFPDAVRALAKEQSVPLIDLHAMSKTLYEALGPEKSGLLFKTGDGTHHNNYGAYELAKCVVEGIRQNKLDLARFLADDVTPFDPTKPDPIDGFKLPASPQRAAAPPDGK
ncbi:MAG: rhamnogalacturonan acetylesterase [Gemmataceae bacterium]